MDEKYTKVRWSGILVAILILSFGALYSTSNFKKNESKQVKYEFQFDYFWKKTSVELTRNFKDNVEVLADNTISNIEQDCLKHKISFTAEEKKELKDNLVEILLRFNFYEYFYSSKNLFLQKMGVTETELTKTLNSLKTAEDVSKLDKKMRKAAFFVGSQVWKSQDLKKSIDKLLDDFWKKKNQKL